MKKRVIMEPVYKTEKVKTGEKENITYISDDGLEFNNEGACIQHEKKAGILARGRQLIEPLDFVDEELVIRLVFGGFGSLGGVKFFSWVANRSLNDVEAILDYLRALGCTNIYEGNLTCFQHGEQVLIASWNEDWNSDYPSFYTKTLSYKDGQKIMKDFYEAAIKTLT